MHINRQVLYQAAFAWVLIVSGFALHHELQGETWALSIAHLPFAIWVLYRFNMPGIAWALMFGFLVFTAIESAVMDSAWPDKSRWVDVIEVYLILIFFGLFSCWILWRWFIRLAIRRLEKLNDEMQCRARRQQAGDS